MLYTPMTKKAMQLAYKAHDGALDGGGMPYILHSARVADGFTREAEACVAWLHDAFADTPLTIDEVRLEGFGCVICDALLLLTRDEAVPYPDYVAAIARDPIARAVKLADLRDDLDASRMNRLDAEAGRRMEQYRAAYRQLGGT